jgi:two-component system, NarL family, nitrate/nitrite response regulator NarL
MQLPNGLSIRVLVVSDVPLISWALQGLIEKRHPALILAGVAHTLPEATDLMRKCAAEVVLLDVGGAIGVNSIAQLIAGTHAKVLVVNTNISAETTDAVVLAGGQGLIGKQESIDIMYRAIEKIHEGEFWIDRSATVRLLMTIGRGKKNADPDAAKIALLTRKERETVLEVTRDANASTTEIAERLNIGENTLRNHLTSIYSKLGVKNRISLFDFAKKHMTEREFGATD